MSTIFALVSFAPHHSRCSEGEADGCYVHSEPASQSRNTELGDLVFIVRGKQACSLSWRKMLPHPAKLLAANTSLRNGLRMLCVQYVPHTLGMNGWRMRRRACPGWSPLPTACVFHLSSFFWISFFPSSLSTSGIFSCSILLSLLI